MTTTTPPTYIHCYHGHLNPQWWLLAGEMSDIDEILAHKYFLQSLAIALLWMVIVHSPLTQSARSKPGGETSLLVTFPQWQTFICFTFALHLIYICFTGRTSLFVTFPQWQRYIFKYLNTLNGEWFTHLDTVSKTHSWSHFPNDKGTFAPPQWSTPFPFLPLNPC